MVDMAQTPMRTAEYDFGWHKDPVVGTFRVTYREADGVTYAWLVASAREEVLATMGSIEGVRLVLAYWADDNRDLAWFKDRLYRSGLR